MTAITIKGFRGKVPRRSERLLSAEYATEALNCKITSGRLDPLKGLQTVATMAAPVTTMYRYRNNAVDYWLTWSTMVDAVRSPTSNDLRNRVYYTGDGEPRMSSFADAINGGGPYPAGWFVLGVYIPTTKMTVAVTGGSAGTGVTQDSRAYIYTLVTQYGEEGAPSPASTIQSGYSNATWTLSGWETVPPNTGTVTGATVVTAGQVRVAMDTTRGLQQYERIVFANVVGMTDLNGVFTIAAVVDATHVDVTLSTIQTYTSGGTWARQAPHNTTNMTRRIYRSVAGTNAGSYLFVKEIPATDTTTVDSTLAGDLGAACPSYTSYTPPKNGHSLVALANGALAMLVGNQLCVSEQYKPYSWPIGNRSSFAGLGVGLTAAGNSVIILTDQYPLVGVCSVPEAIQVARIPTYAPCVAKLGIVDIGGACLYPSHDGLYMASPTLGANNLTESLYRYDEWQRLSPASFKAALFDERYYALHDPGTSSGKLLMMDMKEPDSVVELDATADSIYRNVYDGKLYLSRGKTILQWDADDSNRFLSFWQSAVFVTGAPSNFACAQVYAKYDDIVPADTTTSQANQVVINTGAVLGMLGATELGMYPLGATNLKDQVQTTVNRVQFSLVADGQIVFSKALTDSNPFRLPGFFRRETHQIQLSTSLPIYEVAVAGTMKELGVASQ